MAEWISVKDRLPEENGRYLCCAKAGKNTIVQKVYDFCLNLEEFDKYDFHGIKRPGFFYFDSDFGFLEVPKVTHWMPLPEPPKGE